MKRLRMKQTTLIIVFMLAASASAFAQHPDDHKAKFWLSTGIYAAGTFTDIYTSRGMREANPLLRNSKGGLSVPRAIGVAAIPYAITLWLDHKHHSRAANILRFTLGSFHYGVAVHNYRLRGLP